MKKITNKNEIENKEKLIKKIEDEAKDLKKDIDVEEKYEEIEILKKFKIE